MESEVSLREKRAAVFERMKAVTRTASPGEWGRLDAEIDALTRQIEDRERAEANYHGDSEFASEAEFTEFIQTRGSSEIDLAFRPGVERRDLLAGSGVGASAIPPGFLAALREYLIEVSGIRQAGATVIISDSGAPLKIPRATAHGTATLVAEAGPILENDPTFSAVTLDSYKYANMAQLSREFIEDEAAALVLRRSGRNVDDLAAEGQIHVENAGGGAAHDVVIVTSWGEAPLAEPVLQPDKESIARVRISRAEWDPKRKSKDEDPIPQRVRFRDAQGQAHDVVAQPGPPSMWVATVRNL